jgi:steroid 5-alpha reductase family enzyme
MSLLLLAVGVTAGLCLAMAGAWTFLRKGGDGGWADVVWTFATGAAGLAYAVVPTVRFTPGPRAAMVAMLFAGWSLRLGVHLWRRTTGAAHADARYAELRRQWGPTFARRMFVFLQTQALASALLTLVLLAAARNPAPFPAWSDFAGMALLAAAVVGEGAADAQLAHYKADPAHKGGICDAGLWSWSRHPNYFFEWLGWLAYAVIAIGPAGVRPLAWAALLGPAFMFLLLRFVSGVPPTEAAMAKTRGAAFAQYQARVSAFFPLPPRAADTPLKHS